MIVTAFFKKKFLQDISAERSWNLEDVLKKLIKNRRGKTIVE